MTQEQISFLRRNNLFLYLMSVKDLITLQTIVQDELDILQEIRNKELKLELATKVEEASGKDQGIEILKLELHVARKKYAKRLSQFDENKQEEESITPTGEDRLTPIGDSHMTLLNPEIKLHNETPVWTVSEVMEDGTERVLGYQ